MKDIAIILFCAFALALGEEEIELNDNGCPVNITIFKVLEHDTYCNLFYQCDRGDRVELSCPVGLLFNRELGVCDWSVNVDCGNKGIFEVAPDTEEEGEEEEEEEEEAGVKPGGNGNPSLAPEICANEESDGVLVAHENCDKFYVCERRAPAEVQCPDGLLFNYNFDACDWATNVECGDRNVPELTSAEIEAIIVEPLAVYEACARGDPNGLLLAHENCNRFYKCSSGLPVVFTCPSGLVYNIEISECDWQYNVVCGDRIIVEDEKVEEGNNEENDDNDENAAVLGHSDPSQAPAICAAEESDGVLVAHEHCNQFYKCSQGAPLTLDCPLNLLYNPEREICDWPQNVDCGSRVKSSK